VIYFHSNRGRRDRPHSRKQLQCPMDMHSPSEQQQTAGPSSVHPALASKETFHLRQRSNNNFFPLRPIHSTGACVHWSHSLTVRSGQSIEHNGTTGCSQAAVPILDLQLSQPHHKSQLDRTTTLPPSFLYTGCPSSRIFAISLSYQQTQLALLGRPFTHALAASSPRSQHHSSVTFLLDLSDQDRHEHDT
jgi:hypothetical protein